MVRGLLPESRTPVRPAATLIWHLARARRQAVRHLHGAGEGHGPGAGAGPGAVYHILTVAGVPAPRPGVPPAVPRLQLARGHHGATRVARGRGPGPARLHRGDGD